VVRTTTTSTVVGEWSEKKGDCCSLPLPPLVRLLALWRIRRQRTRSCWLPKQCWSDAWCWACERASERATRLAGSCFSPPCTLNNAASSFSGAESIRSQQQHPHVFLFQSFNRTWHGSRQLWLCVGCLIDSSSCCLEHNSQLSHLIFVKVESMYVHKVNQSFTLLLLLKLAHVCMSVIWNHQMKAIDRTNERIPCHCCYPYLCFMCLVSSNSSSAAIQSVVSCNEGWV